MPARLHVQSREQARVEARPSPRGGKPLIAALTLLSCVVSADAGSVQDLNTLRSFPKVETKAEWQDRAREIREHVQMSCGLWPMPPRSPLKAKVFDRVEREGYTVEKVYFETYPGFFLAGNLYRPLGKGNGPFPAILNPHGHWNNGRFADEEMGSIAARCISFARQGMVAFSYDMVGYNDTRQVPEHRKFALDPTNQLWNISLMGLQTWNSIRALDFLETLPDVDKQRLACTGESGGGTQTFILGAIDDRLAVQAPIVMVSHSMQGGCLCENAPGLRVDYSNMEIAAAPAPRPQVIVAATGDWTSKTMEVEGPSIESVYKLFHAADRFHYAIFDYPHNYNKTTREEVYGWFAKWLLNQSSSAPVREADYQKESDADLRVFPEGKYPPGARTQSELLADLVKMYKAQLAELQPEDAASLEKWKRTMGPAFRHALQLHDLPAKPGAKEEGEKSSQKLQFTINGGSEPLPCLNLRPAESEQNLVAVLVHPDGMNAAGQTPLAKRLLESGVPVLSADFFLTGNRSDPEFSSKRDHFTNFFSTYNRTDLQERVREIALLCQHARTESPGKKVVLIGTGKAGLWTMLASSHADAVVADGAQFDADEDKSYLDRNVFFPGVKRLGGLEGALALAAPNPVFVQNTGNALKLENLKTLYRNLPQKPKFAAHEKAQGESEVLDWILGLAAPK